MRKSIFRKIKIPFGVEVTFKDNTFFVKGKEGQISRTFKPGKVEIKIEGDTITIGNDKATKNEKKIMNTIFSHLNNMIKGVQHKFEYKLKICHGHFPFTVKNEGRKFFIKNFLGEKIDRIVMLPESVDIELTKEYITIRSVDKELVGIASAKLEIATKVRNRDIRIFQDGIYLVNKAGKQI